MDKEKLQLYLHTVLNLKIKQILFRIFYKLRKYKLKNKAAPVLALWENSWDRKNEHSQSISSTSTFTFLNETGQVSTKDDWNQSSKSKLWLYNLHYFDFINAKKNQLAKESHIQLIKKWISENPPLYKTAWEPYCLSLRIVNIIKFYSRENIDNSEILSSLSIQTSVLYDNIEHHILGNHILENGKALIFAGCFFNNCFSKRWLSKGINIVNHELEEQFLKDGGHFELSPMYHSIMIWNMLDLINLYNISKVAELSFHIKKWEKIVISGLSWIKHMSHPDNKISFFNDSCFNIAPTLDQLFSYAKSLNIEPLTSKKSHKLYYLEQSGYAISKFLDHKLICDIGNIGPLYQPGHAHADTLSFELSLFGLRVFVNSGTSVYGQSKERHRQRSTASHNTVVVDNKNSSEVWSGFRVARRAKIGNITIEETPLNIDIKASHNGYHRLSGKVTHYRSWSFAFNELIITDSLSGSFNTAEARFYCHPSVEVKDNNSIELKLPNNKSAILNFDGSEKAIIKKVTWHPEFGKSIPTHCIIVKFQKNILKTVLAWDSNLH